MPSACPAASPSGVLRSVPSMPTSVAPSAEPFAENATRHLPRPSGVCVAEQRAVSQAAHQLHLRVYYGRCRRFRRQVRRAQSHLRHHATRRLLCRLRLLAACGQPAHPLHFRVYYGACRRCRRQRCRTLSYLRHHPPRRLCAVCVSEHHAISLPSSYAFGCTTVCAVDADVSCAKC
jgi:hypothetical protein